MKRNRLIIMVTVVIMLMPLYAFGQENSDYFALKLGQYSPTGDLDDAGIGSGVNGEFVFGTYLLKNFSYETSVGYFQTDETFTGFVSGLGTVSEKNKIKVVPFLLTLKGHIPLKAVELYGGLGIGFYFAKIYIDANAPIGSASFSDRDTVFEYHCLAGINFNITKQLFLGIEAKMFKTSDFSFNDTDQGITLDGDIDLDGYTISGQIGYRF